jgi:hypothetical protein
MRRVASTKANASQALFLLTWFKGSIDFERIHPLESGFMRRKSRLDRRPGMKVEAVWRFYPKYWSETAAKLVQWGLLYLRLRRIYLRIKHNPDRYSYTDLAMTPVAADEAETHELFQTDVAKAFVGREQHMRNVREGREIAASPA